MEQDKIYHEYIGIADSEGLDCFGPADKMNVSQLMFRIRFNSHRKPIIFKAVLEPHHINMINKVQDNRTALTYIKKYAVYLGAHGHNIQEHWDSLPHYPNSRIVPIDRDMIPIKQLSLDLTGESDE